GEERIEPARHGARRRHRLAQMLLVELLPAGQGPARIDAIDDRRLVPGAKKALDKFDPGRERRVEREIAPKLVAAVSRRLAGHDPAAGTGLLRQAQTMRADIGADIEHGGARPHMARISRGGRRLELTEEIDGEIDPLREVEGIADAVPGD